MEILCHPEPVEGEGTGNMMRAVVNGAHAHLRRSSRFPFPDGYPSFIQPAIFDSSRVPRRSARSFIHEKRMGVTTST